MKTTNTRTTEFKQAQEFYLFNGNMLEQHIVAGSFINGGEKFYIFTPEGVIHNIRANEMFGTPEEARLERIKRLKDSANDNLEQAEVLEEGKLEFKVISQEKIQ